MARLVPKIYPLDVNEDIPIGLSFPLQMGTPRQNYITSKQVHTNLQNLILTMKGERPMQPEFGCDLYNLLFEPAEEGVLTTAAREAIENSIDLWMPEITIQDVFVESQPEYNLIEISVMYTVEGWPAENTLNLKVKV